MTTERICGLKLVFQGRNSPLLHILLLSLEGNDLGMVKSKSLIEKVLDDIETI